MNSLWHTGRFESALKRNAWLRYLPWVVLTLLLAGSWELWKSAERHAIQQRQMKFDAHVQGAADRIKQRMQDYEQMLYGTRGFFINQREVEHREFAGYIASLQLAQKLPGIQGVSYAPLVPGRHKQAHIAAMRKDGLAGYSVWPDGARSEYAPVAYIEPLAGRNAHVLGFDNFSSPARRAKLEAARDLDQAMLSEKLTLIQEDGQNPQPGALMFLPVYRTDAPHATVAERRANIAGWLAASFRMHDLFAGLAGRDADEFDIEIYDGSEASAPALLFDLDNDDGVDGKAPQFEASAAVAVAGRTWLLKARSLPAFEAATDKSKAYLTALVAVLLSLILAWITAVLVRDRGRAVRLAEGVSSELQRTKEFQSALQESERRWKLALEAAGHGVWDWDLQADVVTYSGLSLQIIERSADECPTTMAAWQTLIHPDDLPQVRAAHQMHLDGKAPIFNAECRVAGKNSGWKWIVSRGMVVERDAHGQPTRMLGTHADISERKAAETALRLSEAKLQAIIDHAPVGIWLVGVDGRYQFLNKTFCDGIGVPEAELLAANLGDVLGTAAAAACVQSDRAALTQDGPHLSNETLTFADGKPHQLEVRKVRLQDALGETIGVLGISVDVTEQREREEALRESEVRYREIFNDSSYFIFTLDAASRITFAPPILGKLTGYATEEIIGAHIGKILTPASMDRAQKMIAMKLQGEAAVTQYEMDLLCKDGSITPIEVNTALIYRHGKMAGVQGAGRDITERYRYAQSLRESEEKYRGLFESAGDFAYSTDLAGHFTAVSDALLEATGYHREDLVGAPIGTVVAPEYLALAQRMTAVKLSGANQVTRYEMAITDRAGRRIPVEIVSTLVFKDGVPVRVQGIGRDITERKHAEEMLRRSERNYRELMEQAADAIFVTDHGGRHCVDVNQAGCDLLGYTREELMTLEVSSIFHPEEMANDPIRFDEVRSGVTVFTRRRFRRKDGSYVPVELSSRMLPDGRLQAVVRDISKWIERESALREANSKAEAASRTKSEFLANMSHEIRTPMNSVIGMARLALSRETDARQADYLEKILMSGEHLLGIIDDILDFSKIEAGKIRIENSDFDLRGLLGNLATLMADKAAAKELAFMVEVDPALPGRMQGDPLRLRQILLNFADNAIKFTAHGEVRVRATGIDDGATGGSTVQFEVSDTGIGMSGVEMAMLFRPFQQTDGSVTRKYGGTGLGLSICKRLVELMGGDVGVESKPGRGSRFWFRVRLEECCQDGVPAVEGRINGQDVQAALRNARILLAENNVFNQQVAREFLEIAGCVVRVAGDGAEALNLLHTEHFDCVLMDVQMPHMDGIEATRQIRTNQAFASMPIIAVTANALGEERKRCLEAGMNDFLAKPVRPEMLYAVLAKWLSRYLLPLSFPDRRQEPMGASATKSPIDFSVLAELVGDDPERMRQMAVKFMTSAKQDMRRIEAALEQNDLAELRALGHHVKSPAAMVGAAELADLCRTLETGPDDLGQARATVRRMQAVLAEIERQVEAQFA